MLLQHIDLPRVEDNNCIKVYFMLTQIISDELKKCAAMYHFITKINSHKNLSKSQFCQLKNYNMYKGVTKDTTLLPGHLLQPMAHTPHSYTAYTSHQTHLTDRFNTLQL